jgi:hypothetical protein
MSNLHKAQLAGAILAVLPVPYLYYGPIPEEFIYHRLMGLMLFAIPPRAILGLIGINLIFKEDPLIIAVLSMLSNALIVYLIVTISGLILQKLKQTLPSS